MPRYIEPETATPFGKVLVDYMWSRRPPLGAVQLAVRLRIPKQSVTNWVMRGSSPSLETILYVLAKLDIPLRTLYDAYKSAGLSVPRFDDTSKEPPIVREERDTGQRKETRIPVALDTAEARAEDDNSAKGSDDDSNDASNDASDDDGGDELSPRPYVTPPPLDPAAEHAREWDDIIAQTTDALRARHMPDESIQAVIASLRDRQAGANPRERHSQAEHSTKHIAPVEDTLSSAPAEPKQTVKSASRRRTLPAK